MLISKPQQMKPELYAKVDTIRGKWENVISRLGELLMKLNMQWRLQQSDCSSLDEL